MFFEGEAETFGGKLPPRPPVDRALVGGRALNHLPLLFYKSVCTLMIIKKIVLKTHLLTDYSVIKAYSLQFSANVSCGPFAAKFYCFRSCCEVPGPKSIPQSYRAALTSNDIL